MTHARRRMPAWMSRTVFAVCVAWCGLMLLTAVFPTAGGVRPVRPLGVFTHDPAAGAIPWRVRLQARRDSSGPAGVEAVLAWKRRSDAGLPMTVPEKRWELVVRGDAPPGVAPPSVEDAQALLQSAFATLPADADAELISARNAFLGAIAPRSAGSAIRIDALLLMLSVPIAVLGAILSLRSLRAARAEAMAESGTIAR